MGGFFEKHPIVNFIFFAFVLVFAMFSEHPAILIVGLLLSGGCAWMLAGGKTLLKRLCLLLPLMLFTALINPLISHEGNTVLFYFPTGSICTLEAVLYGVSAGVRLGTVLLWFVCWNCVMTSDKFLYLFGRIFPSLSLTISAALRFVPYLLRRFREVSDAQKCLDPQGKGMRHAGKVLSAVVSWALENALNTADSMKSRGYGLKKRSAFSVFSFTVYDAVTLAALLLLGGGVIAGWMSGALSWQFYPSMHGSGNLMTGISTASYVALGLIPMISKGREVLQWHLSRSKI